MFDGKVVKVFKSRNPDRGILVADIKRDVVKLKGILYEDLVVICGEEYDLSDTRRLEGMGVEVDVPVATHPRASTSGTLPCRCSMRESSRSMVKVTAPSHTSAVMKIIRIASGQKK
jgi:hypothetical protein